MSLALVAGLYFLAPQQQVCDVGPNAAQKHCATHHMPYFVLWYVGTFVDLHNGAIIAIATIALFIATYRLWKATGEMVAKADTASANTIRQMKETAERELRAYVGLRRGKFSDQIAADEVSVEYKFRPVIKNSGRTPAYDVSYVVRAFINDFLSPTFDYGLEGATVKRIGVLGPGEKRTVNIWAEKFYSPEEVAALGPDKPGYLWLYGDVRYRDAFGVNRHTQFAFWINPPTKNWTIHQYHNDAD